MLLFKFLVSTLLIASLVESTENSKEIKPPGIYIVKDFSNLYQMQGLSKEALDLHFTLYKGYVKNTNTLINTISQLAQIGEDQSQEYGALKRRLSWEFNGMRLHEYYFENLGGNGLPDIKSELYEQIIQDFTSFAKWKTNFINTGTIRGVGWVVLYYDSTIDCLFTVWVDDHNIGQLNGCHPIVVMDVWEHAYITQFGLDRKAYLQIFFNNLNWKVIEERFREAKNGKAASLINKQS